MPRSSSWSRTPDFHSGNQGFKSPTGYLLLNKGAEQGKLSKKEE